MHAHINPALQAYLLAITALALLTVLLQPTGGYAISLMVLSGLVLYAVLSTLGQAGRVMCQVVSVQSGNLLVIQVKHRKVRVRVWGIVAPEPGSKHFEPSRQALESLLQNTSIQFRELPDKKRAGHISRDEPLMFFADGLDIAPRLLAMGMAGLETGVTVPDRYTQALGTAADEGLGIHADSPQISQDTE